MWDLNVYHNDVLEHCTNKLLLKHDKLNVTNRCISVKQFHNESVSYPDEKSNINAFINLLILSFFPHYSELTQ